MARAKARNLDEPKYCPRCESWEKVWTEPDGDGDWSEECSSCGSTELYDKEVDLQLSDENLIF